MTQKQVEDFRTKARLEDIGVSEPDIESYLRLKDAQQAFFDAQAEQKRMQEQEKSEAESGFARAESDIQAILDQQKTELEIIQEGYRQREQTLMDFWALTDMSEAEFQAASLANYQAYQLELTRLTEEGNQARIDSNLQMLASFSNSLGGMAMAAKDSVGEQAAVYKALFGLSKGFALAEASLALYTGISQAMKKGVFGLPEAAMIMGQMTAVISAIQGVTLTTYEGGGYTGMGMRSGGIDGRGGFPAILHPNETVIDHREGQTMASDTNITVNLMEDASRAGQVNQRQDEDRVIVDVVVASIKGGGKVRDAIQQTYRGLQVTGR